MTALAWVDLLVGLVVAVDAAVVLHRRRRHPVGLLLAAVAMSWFAGDFAGALLFLHRGPTVHLHLAYPTGRVRRTPARIAMAAAYVVAVVDGFVSLPWVTVSSAVLLAGAALDTFAVSRGPARRAGVPALAAALIFSGALALSAANQLLYWGADLAVALVYDITLAAMMTWLSVDLLSGRWSEVTVAQLVAQLGSRDDADLETALRRATGDPGLVVAPGSTPAPSGRASTPVVDSGVTVATLVHEPSVSRDAALTAGIVEATRLAIANGRLRDDIASRAAALADVRQRLLAERDAQARTLAASIAAGPARELRRAHEALLLTERSPTRSVLIGDIADARNQLDSFAHGLSPVPHGDLHAALKRLQASTAVPVRIHGAPPALPQRVADAIWFVCAEAVTNTAKHAVATGIDIDVRDIPGGVRATVSDNGRGGADPRGTGLVSLADRVAALGGSLDVHSDPGHGTILTTEIPALGPEEQ
ncbi:sensor histidine kinase [Demequina maris]|uniref:sensor histidine kinase n=1 Tax=Demequina maris TaxID=1638982 RepID=UPI000782CC45|nr:ATP-binding protein [Demequina maris]